MWVISGVSSCYTALMMYGFWGLDVGFLHINILRLFGVVVAKKGRALREAAPPLVDSVRTGAGAGQLNSAD